jgi:hypothetical protein
MPKKKTLLQLTRNVFLPILPSHGPEVQIKNAVSLTMPSVAEDLGGGGGGLSKPKDTMPSVAEDFDGGPREVVEGD